MGKKSFLVALLVFAAVLGAEAQNINGCKADTVIGRKGYKTITLYTQGNFAEGNGNIVMRDC